MISVAPVRVLSELPKRASIHVDTANRDPRAITAFAYLLPEGLPKTGINEKAEVYSDPPSSSI